MSAQGNVQFNEFSERNDISLPGRLMSQGFPHYTLIEQCRSHEVIANLSNQLVYNGELRNGPGTGRLLEKKLPVLLDCLFGPHNLASNPNWFFSEKRLDARARWQWIQVHGTREVNASTGSSIVVQHVGIFFNRILPGLLKYSVENKARVGTMKDNIMIICAYTNAVGATSGNLFRLG